MSRVATIVGNDNRMCVVAVSWRSRSDELRKREVRDRGMDDGVMGSSRQRIEWAHRNDRVDVI